MQTLLSGGVPALDLATREDGAFYREKWRVRGHQTLPEFAKSTTVALIVDVLSPDWSPGWPIDSASLSAHVLAAVR